MRSPLSIATDLDARFRRIHTWKIIVYIIFIIGMLMIVLSIKKQNINIILKNFNEYQSRFKFTIELDGNKLNFLDLTSIKEDKNLIYNWYQKSTSSSRYLNYFSCHPLIVKTKNRYYYEINGQNVNVTTLKILRIKFL